MVARFLFANNRLFFRGVEDVAPYEESFPLGFLAFYHSSK